MAAVASAAAGPAAPTATRSLGRLAGPGRGQPQRLLELLAAVHRYRIPPPRGTQESLVEYDRRRGVKEMLLEQIIAARVETGDAARLLRVVMAEPPPGRRAWSAGRGRPRRRSARVLRGDVAGVRKHWRELLAALAEQTLLYVALARGGNPLRIVASRSLPGHAPPPAGLPAAAGPAARKRRN